MIRMLIADDMPMQMHMLEAMVKQLRPDYEVLTARDGLEILRIVEEQVPDFILSDIRMPRMDGLEMIAHIKRDHPDVKVVFLTGYALFEYAQKALKRGASDILIKPIDEETLEATLSKLEREASGGRPARGSDWLLTVNQWLNYPSEQMTVSNWQDVNERFPKGGWIAVAYVRRDLDDAPAQKHRALEAIRRHLSPWPGAEAHLSLRDPHLITIIVPEGSASLPVRLSAMAEDQRLSVGISYFTASFTSGGYEAHQTALNALNEAFYRDLPVAESQVAMHRTPVHLPGVDELNQMLYMQPAERAKRLERAFARLKDERPFFLDLIEHTALSIISLLESLHKQSRNPAMTEIWQQLAAALRRAEGWSAYESTVKGALDSAADALSGAASEPQGGVIAQCLVYVREHYQEQISLADMARRYGLSANYFSALFKRETGQRFVEYLSQLRLSMAVDKLVRTDEFVYEIAKACGYDNERYFIRVFQAAYGLTPNAYRKMHRKDRST